MHVIENRYVETTLHVGAVAQDLGVSTEHLCRVLKRHTGLTFVTLLRRTRVRAACRLLQTTTLSMKEIANRAGFSSASRFDRDFKTVCGVSPSEYRAGFWRHSVVVSGGWWLVVGGCSRTRTAVTSSSLAVFYQFPASNINTRQDFDRPRRVIVATIRR